MDDALSLSPTGKAIRAPRAAAAAGIAFALLLGTVIVIIQIAVPDDPDDAAWVEDDTRRGLVLFALNLLPFAGIAFLWFIGVIRDRLGEGEDRFFATVFLGSGVLFIAMLFATGAVVGSLVVAADEADGALTEDLWSFGRGSGLTLFSVYAMRMAGVFTVSTVSLLMRLKIVPPWLAGLGFVTAAILLLGSGRFAWVGLVFPGWILILSTYLLLTMMRSSEAGNRVASDPPAQL